MVHPEAGFSASQIFTLVFSALFSSNDGHMFERHVWLKRERNPLQHEESRKAAMPEQIRKVQRLFLEKKTAQKAQIEPLLKTRDSKLAL